MQTATRTYPPAEKYSGWLDGWIVKKKELLMITLLWVSQEVFLPTARNGLRERKEPENESVHSSIDEERRGASG